MNDRAVMQQALEALSRSEYLGWQLNIPIIKALRERLAQPEREPVATVESKTGNPDILMSWWHEPALPVGTKLYTTPPRREWQGLTEEEIEKVCVPLGAAMLSFPEVARAIEAKLKEKNNG